MITELQRQQFRLLPYTDPNEYLELLKTALEALKFNPPCYITSIFGTFTNRIPPYNALSEYTILNPWQPLRAARYLLDVSVPSYSHAAGPWARTLLPPFIQSLFWHPSGYFQQPDPYDSDNSFANERWFYINGIATTQPVAQLNAQLISKMFKRPLTVIHNGTNSFLWDLYECAVGKTFETDPDLERSQSMTEPAIKATTAILEALEDPQLDRVVLLCHSQGTIITANVLRALAKALDVIKTTGVVTVQESVKTFKLELVDEVALSIICRKLSPLASSAEINEHTIKLLKRLEIYTFANCADRMEYIATIPDQSGQPVGLPYIENFANQFDLVARLGVLAPERSRAGSVINIVGPVYEKRGKKAWGHLFNEHHLFDIDHYLSAPDQDSGNPYPPTKNTAQQSPRLYRYYNGERVPGYID